MHTIKKITHSSWGLRKDHKKCSNCILKEEGDEGETEIIIENRHPYHQGAPLTYWGPRPPPNYYPYPNSQLPRPPYSSPAASSLIPLQAFHADFPNFVPALGYPLAAYFMSPVVSQTKKKTSPQQQITPRPSNQFIEVIQTETSTSVSPRSSTVTAITTPKSVSLKSSPSEKNLKFEEFENETTTGDSGQGQDLSEMMNSDYNNARQYLGARGLDPVDVRVHQNRPRRAPLFNVYIPETQTPNIKQELLTPPRRGPPPMVKAYPDRNKGMKQQDEEEPRVDVKQEFQRKIKEAAKKDLGGFFYYNGFDDEEAITPILDDVDKTRTFPSPLRLPHDVVDSGHKLIDDNSEGLIDPKQGLQFNGISDDDLEEIISDADLESDKTNEELLFGSDNQARSTVCLDTDQMQVEFRADDSTLLERRRRHYDFSAIPVMVFDYQETGDWKNIECRISHSELFETSPVEFVQELVMWAISKAEAQWHSASGNILRLMIKTQMVDKQKVLELFTVKFIEDRPFLCGLDWTFMLPRLTRLLVEAFFNEGNLDWLFNLKELTLQNPYNLHSWEILANLVVAVFAARTNMDFVYNLAGQSTPGFRLPEILPALRDPEASVSSG